jgi:hypothetical protein
VWVSSVIHNNCIVLIILFARMCVTNVLLFFRCLCYLVKLRFVAGVCGYQLPAELVSSVSVQIMKVCVPGSAFCGKGQGSVVLSGAEFVQSSKFGVVVCVIHM